MGAHVKLEKSVCSFDGAKERDCRCGNLRAAQRELRLHLCGALQRLALFDFSYPLSQVSKRQIDRERFQNALANEPNEMLVVAASRCL